MHFDIQSRRGSSSSSSRTDGLHTGLQNCLKEFQRFFFISSFFSFIRIKWFAFYMNVPAALGYQADCLHLHLDATNTQKQKNLRCLYAFSKLHRSTCVFFMFLLMTNEAACHPLQLMVPCGDRLDAVGSTWIALKLPNTSPWMLHSTINRH